MKFIFLVMASIAYLHGFTQECNKESLRVKPGSWKMNQQGSIKNVSAADLLKEKAVLAGLHKMISKNYQPTGCQAAYSTVYGKYESAGQKFIADPYHYTLYILRYLCDQNSADKSKYYIDASTPTTVTIAANVIFSLDNLFAASLPTDDPRGYLKLKLRPVKKNGAWFMGEEIVGDRGTTSEILEYRWLITYNDTLPFSYLSRKEYLRIQQKRMEQTIKEEGASDFYKTFLRNINEELKKGEDYLSAPAICPWNDEQRFTGFVAEGTSGSFIAVRPNPAYYHTGLPKSLPQFFSVVYKISKGDRVFDDNYVALKKAIDFTGLKNMLGQ